MEIGDTVVRKSYGMDISFKIIDKKKNEQGTLYILKGISIRIVADSPEDDLEVVSEGSNGEKDKIFNMRVNSSIRNVLIDRVDVKKNYRIPKTEIKKDLSFGRPGKILHIDGDSEYLKICMKLYKQFALDAVGKIVPEKEQPSMAVSLVKEVRPDIVVITGHDGVNKDCTDYMNIDNYRNSKYFVQAVSELRSYQSGYDDLVIFAGACQSCYEALLDAGANFASSPGRVLIHCLDPVFVCEKIAYSNIDKVISLQEAVENTITGVKGIGGLQTRGRYREGFPKSSFIK